MVECIKNGNKSFQIKGAIVLRFCFENGRKSEHLTGSCLVEPQRVDSALVRTLMN